MNLSTLEARSTFVRELLNKSAREMSAAVGLSSSMWAYLESGEKPDPRLSTPVKIVKRLGLELAWFATGDGPMLTSKPSLDPCNEQHWGKIRAELLASLEKSEDAPESPPVVVPPPERISTPPPRPPARSAPVKRTRKAA